jgi:spore germination cell wall hydrolase CwlJ-like protein
MFVTLSPRHQMLAASAAILVVSTFAFANATATEADTAAASSAVPAAAMIAPEAPAPAPNTPALAPALAPALNEDHVTCVAKIVHHEAANQPREGQIAVAHVILNRVEEGFAPDVCAVARQPRQFFNIDRYKPNRASEAWESAVAVAREVLSGEAKDHSRGALYFHANWARLDRFFQGRTRVARLDDHDFYR